MNKYNLKEKRNRTARFFIEDNQIILKSIRQNTFIEKPTKLNTTLKISNMTKYFNKIRFVNRCILTGRKNHVHKLFRFSRLVFLRLARNSDIVSLKKGVW
jgi:ribosomal protein S14